ncbi:charged multivesicular body protein 5, partial [Diaphorina citri]|uniref:Charged multivesicular body protein 5 n=1 Tax=Diaphorina citri TaxID=121845 RepID=A0A3Q0J382_DIACI
MSMFMLEMVLILKHHLLFQNRTKTKKTHQTINHKNDQVIGYHSDHCTTNNGKIVQRNNIKAVYVSWFSLWYESQAENLRNQAFNLDQANFGIQSLKDTQQTVIAMKDGLKQMKKEFGKINIDQIE